jgi:hypothetical protein
VKKETFRNAENNEKNRPPKIQERKEERKIRDLKCIGN